MRYYEPGVGYQAQPLLRAKLSTHSDWQDVTRYLVDYQVDSRFEQEPYTFVDNEVRLTLFDYDGKLLEPWNDGATHIYFDFWYKNIGLTVYYPIAHHLKYDLAGQGIGEPSLTPGSKPAKAIALSYDEEYTTEIVATEGADRWDVDVTGSYLQNILSVQTLAFADLVDLVGKQQLVHDIEQYIPAAVGLAAQYNITDTNQKLQLYVNEYGKEAIRSVIADAHPNIESEIQVTLDTLIPALQPEVTVDLAPLPIYNSNGECIIRLRNEYFWDGEDDGQSKASFLDLLRDLAQTYHKYLTYDESTRTFSFIERRALTAAGRTVWDYTTNATTYDTKPRWYSGVKYTYPGVNITFPRPGDRDFHSHQYPDNTFAGGKILSQGNNVALLFGNSAQGRVLDYDFRLIQYLHITQTATRPRTGSHYGAQRDDTYTTSKLYIIRETVDGAQEYLVPDVMYTSEIDGRIPKVGTHYEYPDNNDEIILTGVMMQMVKSGENKPETVVQARRIGNL